MKKLLMTMMAGGAMLAVTSCSSDEPVAAVNADGLVTFTVTAPVDIQSRAMGQGDAANDLRVVVFDENGKYLFTDEHPNEFAGKTTSQVQVQLITGETYKVAFWVDANNLYTIDEGKISMGYTDGVVNLNDNRDAFYNVAEIEVAKNNLNQSITLTRPFAQLNVATEDFARATSDLKKDISKASLKVTDGVYNTLNLANGEATGLIEDPVVFTTADLVATNVLTVGGKSYTYLAMAYLLVKENNGNNLDKAEVTLYDTDGTKNFNGDLSYTSLPLKRNFRTNVIGNLLTSTTDWTIDLGPWAADDINIDLTPWDGTTLSMPTIDTSAKTVTVDTPSELAGLAALVNGTYPGESANNFEGYTLKLDNDVDLGNKEWAPIGNGSRSGSGTSGQVFSGTFDGQGHTISGLKIETTSGKDAGIALFGIVSGGEVKNLNFEDVDINVPTSEMAAAAVGMLTNGGTVSGITVSGNIVAKRGVGAVVGRITIDGTVTVCVNNAAIKATGANAGGIVGAAYYTKEGKTMTISKCENHGVLTSTEGNIGGIVGLSAANVSNCTNYAPITGGAACVAGIVGEQQNAGSVENCENKADIKNTTSTYGTGGIVGWIRYNGTVENYASKNIIEVTRCTNEGSVSGGNDAGGIVGTVYNLGNIHHNVNKAPSLSATTFAAGIVGNAQFTESTPGLSDPNKVEVKNNVSTTAIENITAGCKALYVYKNDPSSVEDENNTQTQTL